MNNSVKCDIIAAKITMYKNTIYDAELDYKVAEVVKDSDLRETAIARIKMCKQALSVLDDELESLECNEEDAVGD